jgi:flavin reductase (DIM6/NTAB) family NADH-FMN oxidoreductase RutF
MNIPEGKKRKGYRHVSDKFKLAGLNPVPSETIPAPRIGECPVQMETTLEAVHGIADDDELQKGKILTLELRVLRIHLEECILMHGSHKRVDPDKWRPLIMSFQKFYGLSGQVHESDLATIPEMLYHSPDMDRSRVKFEKLNLPLAG